jgi:hypothetical protein
MNPSVIIKDNFLPQEDFLNIKNLLLSANFPWYFTEPKTAYKDGINQFFHVFYYEETVRSGFFSVLNPILSQFNILDLFRVKANLNPKTKQLEKGTLHTDTNVDCNTMIYYVNSNDGCTFFENGDSIQSIQNRLVIFPSHFRHAGTSCTDENARCLINFNFA